MWGRRRHVALEPSDILVVCTGNVCRSPYIAALLRHRHPGLAVGSAGIGALVGEPPTPPALGLLAARGVPDPGLVARQLTPEMVVGARLILCATVEHRTAAIELDTAAADRAFTLREIARLLEGRDPEPGLDGLVASAQLALRSSPMTDDRDDLADPFRRPQAAYDEMAVRVDAALDVLNPWLA